MQNGLAICAKRPRYGKRQLFFEEFVRRTRNVPGLRVQARGISLAPPTRANTSPALLARKPLLRSCIVSDTRGDDWRERGTSILGSPFKG